MRVKGTSPIDALPAATRELLVHGPIVGHPLPPHDELRRLWARYGPALTASLPRGRTPWFVERDWFVRQVRREPER